VLSVLMAFACWVFMASLSLDNDRRSGKDAVPGCFLEEFVQQSEHIERVVPIRW
jgi:hypothetical protein